MLPTPRLAAFALASVTAASGLGAAAARADNVVHEYRESVMEAIGGHTGALKAIIADKAPYAPQAKAHVEALAVLAKMTDPLFPAGSGGSDTHALPAVWEKPEQFAKALAAFQTAVADLAKQADATPADMAGPFSAMVKTCKGCHDDFRKKD